MITKHHGMVPMQIINFTQSVAALVVALAVALVVAQIVDVVKVAVLVNVDMRVPAERVGQNVKEINQQLILPVVEQKTAVVDVKQIALINVLTVAPAATHHVPEVAKHILHVMEAIALDVAVNAEVKQTAVQIREVKIVPIVVMSVL